MAQADVVFKIDVEQGDTTAKLEAVEDAVEQVGETAKKAGKQAEDGLSGFVKQVEDLADQKLKSLTGGMIGLDTAMRGLSIAAGIVAAGVAAFGAAVIASVKSAMESEEQANRLRAALEAQGVGTKANADALRDYATALSLSSRFSDEAIVAAQALGLRMGVGAHQIGEATLAALNMSAALGKDLNESMTALAKTLTGTGMGLKKMGVDLGDMSEEALKAGGAIKVVGERFKDAGTKDAQSMAGGLDRVKNAMGEAVESFGMGITSSTDLGKSFGYVADVITGALPFIEQMGRMVMSVAKAIVIGIDIILDKIRALAVIAARIPGPLSTAFSAIVVSIDAVKASATAATIALDTFAAIGAAARQNIAPPELSLTGYAPPTGEGGEGGAGAEVGAAEAQIATIVEQTAVTREYAIALDEVNASLERQSIASAAMVPRQQAEMAATEKQAAQQQRMTMIRNAATNAILNTASAFIDMAISGELSGKKLLAATLNAISQEAKVMAIKELALAAGSYPDFVGMAQHAGAAALWGTLAIGTGMAANSVSGGGESGGGTGGRDDSSSLRDPRSTADAAEDSVQPQGPRVQLVVTGTIIGGTSPEDFARSVQPYLDEAYAEAGGRSGTGRG